MKTIRQAALERYPPENPDVYNSSPYPLCRSAFGFGVEFSEQMIPVTEELPSEENGYVEETVLIQDEWGYIAIGVYTYGEYWDSQDEGVDMDYIISWRPINRK